MGEEEKKTEEKKVEDVPAPVVAEEAKKEAAEEKKSEDGKASKEEKPVAEEKVEPPPPPPEIVLRVYMHCEGCARKVKKRLKGFPGVEEVMTDCKTHKVVVKGEKADPLKVLERVRRKSHRHVDLLSPIPPPKPVADEAKKPPEAEPPKPEEKKEEPKVITVVLKVHMHCEACAQEIKKRIERMKEVEEATPDLKSSEVTVKGTFDPPKLVDYVYRRTGKHAIVIRQEAEETKEEDKGKDGKEEKKDEKNAEEEPKKDGDHKAQGDEQEAPKEKKESGDGGDGGAAAAEGGGSGGDAVGGGAGESAGRGNGIGEEEVKMVEMRRSEYHYYPPRYAMEMYAYPPQIFSDENPNACSIM